MADHDHRKKAAATGAEFVAHASDVFARDLFQPMYERANVAPNDVRRLISEIRHKLDALDIVVETILGHPMPAPSDQGRATQTVHQLNSTNGVASHAAPSIAPDPADPYDDIGRNQRSRLRELTLLDFLARETRPFSLQQVLGAIGEKGFEDTSGAVVSQLHRLKKLGVINQPAGGMYEITPQGLSHLHQLRSSFGSLLGSAHA